MPSIETMRVIVKDGGHPALINASDFDPEKFEAIVEELSAPPTVEVEISSDSSDDEPEEPKKKRGRK